MNRILTKPTVDTVDLLTVDNILNLFKHSSKRKVEYVVN